MSTSSGAFSVAKRELNAASRHLTNMHKCKTFEAMDREWRGFLVSIEKVWKKAERGGVSVNKGKFGAFQKPYKDAKKNDQLLNYILHARNSDEHSIQEVVDHLMNYSCIPLGIVTRTMNGPDEIVSINPQMKPSVQMKNKFELAAVTDRGVEYNAPFSDDKITGRMSPIEAAGKALTFYQNYMNAIERDFLANIKH